MGDRQALGAGARTWRSRTWRRPATTCWRATGGAGRASSTSSPGGGDALVFVEVKTRSSARLRRSRGGGVAGQGPPDPGAGRALAERVPAAGPAGAALRRGVDRAARRPGARPRAPRGRVLMPLAKSLAVALVGLDGHVVEVEADLANGIPGLSITGLPDAALNEARDRVRAAVVNSGTRGPTSGSPSGCRPLPAQARQRLRPGPRRRLLAASEQVRCASLEGCCCSASSAWTGRVKPVPGVLPALVAGARPASRGRSSRWPTSRRRGCCPTSAPRRLVADALVRCCAGSRCSRPFPLPEVADEAEPEPATSSRWQANRPAGSPARSPRPAATTC